MRVALLAAGLIAATLLSGCSDPPAAGLLAPAAHSIPLQATATNTYVAFSAGGNPASQLPVGAPATQCAQDQVPAPVPPESPVQKCTPASTTITVTAAGLPSPGSGTYEVYLAGGTMPEQKVDALQTDETGAATVNHTFDRDLTPDGYETVQIRLGAFVLATAPAAAGPQAFTLVAYPIQVQSSFSGNQLNLVVSGLPEGVDFTGRLYTAEGAAQTPAQPAETFPVHNGNVTFTTTKAPVGDYAEFHIHVADSRINLHKETVQIQADT